jgi:hypothetical protein
MAEHYGHPAAWPVDRLLERTRMTRTRRSGPGGQHRNRVATAVVLRHEPTGVEASASERREPEANRKVAVRRLRTALALKHREPVDLHQDPSDLWRRRVREGRIEINPKHADYAAMLAEALDWLAAYRWEVKFVAEQFGTTVSQLVRFLKHEPEALGLVNEQRRLAGKKPMK